MLRTRDEWERIADDASWQCLSEEPEEMERFERERRIRCHMETTWVYYIVFPSEYWGFYESVVYRNDRDLDFHDYTENRDYQMLFRQVLAGKHIANLFRFTYQMTKSHLASPSVKREEQMVRWVWFLHDRREVDAFFRPMTRKRKRGVDP